MYSYSYVPPRDVKKSALVSLVGFVLGFLLVALSNVLPYAPTVLQIIGIAVLAVSIFFTARYVVRSYVYSTLQIGEGDYDLVINEVSGKSSKAVCRINADEITDFIYSEDGKLPNDSAQGIINSLESMFPSHGEGGAASSEGPFVFDEFESFIKAADAEPADPAPEADAADSEAE